MTALFLIIVTAALLAVFAIDCSRKRREFLQNTPKHSARDSHRYVMNADRFRLRSAPSAAVWRAMQHAKKEQLT